MKRNILFTLQTGLIILLNGCTDTSLAQNKVIVPKIGYFGDADNASYIEAQIKIEGSCVYLMNTNDRVIPIFATKDAHWDSNKYLLIIDSKEYKDGETIAYGSEEAYPINLNNYKWIIKPDTTCDLSKGVIINQFIEPLTKK
ncbi:hypothetical protein [Acinetobacter pittii]|uniref:hypothetical protein n=1 Tax=Acinetobacter TaxID=469 RepID=UPI00070BC210|nr:hypothetical protein [Acinetobacter pittii]KRI80186.1 hypothetical protein APC68_07810 [Acinetobacter pittii]KRJ20721.1 hypothetical protein APC78_16780 [Acinetobacter pittii]KRJ66850.1 hypothetical protein APC92_10315 [Acinetobacter pittii]MBJ9719053.1 hypothetical protein [Acinetobacter pittii]MBJ9777270.1 hypothetical protein [Acinetobacter pittii]